MKIGVIGSRSINNIPLEKYIPFTCDEIVSGGARGVDTCAANYARTHHIKLTEFLPAYECYGRAAPLIRNKQIVDYSDMVLAFWDGASKGTLSVIHYCEKTNTPCQIIRI